MLNNLAYFPSTEGIYIMYLRKSRVDLEAEARGEGETFARHEKILMSLSGRNGHYIPPENIYREVVSGELISERPEIQRIIQRMRTERIAGVYVVELERLARGDTVDQGVVSRVFKYTSTKIMTPIKTYDPNDPYDEEFLDYGLFRSRGEFKTINRRLQAGRMASINEGKYIASKAGYGYRRIKIKKSKGYTLEIFPEENTFVFSMFNWYRYGRDGEPMGITAIAHHLEDIGAPVGENGKRWTPTRVYRILTNHLYAGYIRWGYDKLIRELDNNTFDIKKLRVITGEYVLVKGIHPPTVSEQLFDEVQEMLHNHGKIPVNKTSAMSNPLSRIVYCSVCGRAMLGNPGFDRTPAYIKCRTRNCPTVQTAREPVENLILDTLRHWLHAYDVGHDIVFPVDQEHDISIYQSALATLRSEMETLLKQRNTLYDLVEQGVYSQQVFNERYAILNERMLSVDSSIRQNEFEIKKRPNYKSLAELAPQIRTVLEAYATAPNAEAKNTLLKTVISRVEYSKSIRGIPGVSSDQFTLHIFPCLK